MSDDDDIDITDDIRERIGDSNDLADAIKEEKDSDTEPIMTHDEDG